MVGVQVETPVLCGKRDTPYQSNPRRKSCCCRVRIARWPKQAGRGKLRPPARHQNSRHLLARSFSALLAAFPHTISLDTGAFIHSPPICFHPSVRLEGQFLCSQNHLSRDSLFSEKVNRDEGALQAKSLLRIPCTGVIDRRANAVDGVLAAGLVRNLPLFHFRVRSIEGTKSIQDVEG